MQSTEVLESAKVSNPLKALLDYGQSMWLDYIRRDLITSGKLKTMIDVDGLRGMTSNPSIFEKAIADSHLYDDMLKSLASQPDLNATSRYEQIAIRDIQDAGDDRRRPALVEGGESRERDDQGAGHGGRSARNSPAD